MKACMKQFLKRKTIHAKDQLEFSAGWRAALEEVYNQLDYSEQHQEIKDWIEKELGEE